MRSLVALALVPALAAAAPAQKVKAAPAGSEVATKTPAGPVFPSGDTRGQVLDAVIAELDRSMALLKLGENEKPFFLGLQVKDFDSREVTGRFGAIYENSARRYRNVLADVRVGSYELDSTADPDAFGVDFDFETGGYSPAKDIPLDDRPQALRTALWLVIDDQYKRALAAYLKKRGRAISKPDEPDRAVSFTREQPVSFAGPAKAFSFAAGTWADEVRRVSAQLQNRPGIFDSEMRVTADKVVRTFASSEGTRLVSEQVIFGLHVTAVARAADGMLLQNARDFYGTTERDLPRGDALDREVATMLEELAALREAPVVDPFTGPALLAPEATGVLFHEAVGHRLEGERQDDENEGRTFKGQVGKPVLPPFVSLLDDPTLATFRLGDRDVPLNGFYLHDEQGVAAQPVLLVEGGVLRTYLMSRRPVKGFTRSNGHGRSAGNRMPVARMANLLVKPSKSVPDATLKGMLLDEVRRQNKPYGIFIKDITGGNTNTSNSGYQAFKGMSRLVYRIDPSGREELVRGVEIVGTPLSSINRILAMGDRYGIFNGFCGAESGYVPVSAIAPAALVGEIELQRTHKNLGRPPVIPAP